MLFLQPSHFPRVAFDVSGNVQAKAEPSSFLDSFECLSQDSAGRERERTPEPIYMVMEVRVGLVEAVVSIDNRQVDRAIWR